MNFDSDRLVVMDSARQVGVSLLVNPAVDVESSRKIISLAHTIPEVFAAVGVHPNGAVNWDEQALPNLEELAKQPKVVAIGEIGLDYYRDYTPRPLQIRVLEQQLELAARLGLPVILHNREASQDMIAILHAWHTGLSARVLPLADRPGVLHSFTGDASTAKRAGEMNFFIGITGPVTYPNANDLRRIVSQLPLEQLLIETDAPFLAPQPRRGNRNEPANVRFVAEKIAELHQTSYAEIAKITSTNARLLFQIGEKSLA